MNKKVILFAVIVLLSGWIGLGLDVLLKTDFTQGLGNLFFIAAPLLACIVFTLVEKKKLTSIGLKLNFKKNIKWYIFCLFFDFIIMGIIYFLGITFNGIQTPKSLDFFWTILLVAISAIPFTFIKNIFEETGWRGYLVPRLFKKDNKLISHLFIAVVWATWHIPYWLFFLNKELVLSNSPYGVFMTIFVSYVALFFLSLIYDNLRIITNSIWPSVIIHTMFNVSAMAYYKLVQYNPSTEWIFSPSAYGIIYLIVILGVGAFLTSKKAKLKKE